MRNDIAKLSSHSIDSIYLFQRFINLQALELVGNMLGNVIDFEASKSEAFCVVRDGVSDELDSARDNIAEIEKILADMSIELANAYPEMRGIAVKFIPRVGYAISCPVVCPVPRSFVFQFEEGPQRYYKDTRCVALDERYGGMHRRILDLQQQLLLELYEALMGHEASFYDMIDMVSELDCFLSLARAARGFNFARPVLCNDVVFTAKAVRHPLQELTVESYIPNDISIDASTGFMNVLTGENGSGKSVFLKMVGVLQIMAQIGSFIPALEGLRQLHEITTGIAFWFSSNWSRHQAIHPSCDDGITSSFETVLLSHSSFTIDCNQIAAMLRHCDQRSLLLIDEYGKGTAAIDGVCLLTAVLKTLKAAILRNGGPKVLVTTHYLEIFHESCLKQQLGLREVHHIECHDQARVVDESSVISCFVLSSVPASATSKDKTQTVALYEAIPGIATSSNAFRCASAAGVDNRVLTRAQYVLDCRHSKTPLTPWVEQNERDEPFEALTRIFIDEAHWLTASDESLEALRAQTWAIRSTPNEMTT
ncbi:mutS-like protein [Achlya hypogyna]|uniref:MutS-like protein n=1 Tax=Achlya hypogyna TaxID=1202772 RepID=A0A1V9YIX5_ACHHY|nr:mutS-like protein [Achlya hypogyna]